MAACAIQLMRIAPVTTLQERREEKEAVDDIELEHETEVPIGAWDMRPELGCVEVASHA